ncbi:MULTISPECIES: conjugal transfer protein TraC [Cysteiniphilum]|uniref:Uncharacterized protein n=2 Tax=Cysteiniphilum litorale TaxID=2056700 RepID=A0A8J3EBM9_9GAMM|nr:MULTISPECIES: conjugal transfer protein TraC [Cysteiniphilum]GGG09367.1 hypothetical protein GCM10010995_28760 [Cysteiniphilum litorale]
MRKIDKISKTISSFISTLPFFARNKSPFAVLKKYAQPKGVGHFHHLLPYRFYDRERGIFHNQYAGDGVLSRQGVKDRKSKNGKQGFGFGLQLAPLTGASLNLAKDLNDLIVSKLPAGKKFSYQFSLLGHR